MATPISMTIQELDGLWVMDKNLTSELDPMMKMQGIPWPLRKAICLTNIRLRISTYTAKDIDINIDAHPEPVKVIDVLQTTTGNLAGTNEVRTMNWALQKHKDYIFGTVKSWSRFIDGARDMKGNMRPDVEVQTEVTDNSITKFLRGEILPDGITRCEGFLVEPGGGDGFSRGCWVQTFARGVDTGWTAEQIWGFENINGKRYYTRRVVIANVEGGSD
ncbi:uncharacterized protein N7446_004922 [Penicillium canescens]|uniref:uncharacterized protein n=1 Tax=Penicillium canescens TaxID=5083 RepID=UPI0026E07192|nr:uncharacterized protein N7446_004922 [Penicillium canescens]KAJ6067885.1 hypothetical protein N7446_004922 [Penicillium canescens]